MKTLLLLLFVAASTAVAAPPADKPEPPKVQPVQTDGFCACAIPDSLFRTMQGLSFKENCTTQRNELCYLRLLHYDFDGRVCQGELVCNRAVADDLLAIFRALYEARYPIRRMVLIDRYGADDKRSMQADNTAAFNFRFVAGTTRLSAHSRGMAVDINPIENPCVRRHKGQILVEPDAGRPFADRTRNFRGKIDTADLCYKLFTQHGFTWGGGWRSLKDYQHFEKQDNPKK